MASFLGLDLGSHSVKAVVFESTMRGYQTRAFRTVPLAPPAADAPRFAALESALQELLAQGPWMIDQVVVALPGPSLATHQISLPFTDPKRIEATIGFEVESQLPFDLADAVFDYQVTSQQDKKSELLVGVVRKNELRELLEVLHRLKLDPRVVTHPGLAFQNLLALFPPAPAEDSVAILDIGHERTSLAVGRPGEGVEFARTFAGGGKELTRLLAQELSISLEEAERWKLENGSLGTGGQLPESERAASALARGVQALLRELRPSLKAYTARTRKSLSRIYVCGGSSRLGGLCEYLSRELGLPVERLDLPPESTAEIPAEQAPVAALAYCLALRAQVSGAKAPRFNLRRGELAFKGDFDYVREKLGRLVAFAAILLVLLIATGVVRNVVLAKRERAVDAMLCEITQRVLGSCEKDFNKALNMLQGKESPAANLPELSAVGILAEVVARMPPDVPVTVDQVVIDLDRVSLRLGTDSSKQVDKITSSLKGFRCFQEVQEGKVERSKDGQKVSFRLDIRVQCPHAVSQG